MVKRKVTKRKRKVTKRKRKITKRKRKFGLSSVLKVVDLAQKGAGALQKGKEIKDLMENNKYVGALKKLDEVKGGKTIQNGITALTTQLTTIGGLQIDSPVFTNFMKPVLEGLKTDLSKEEGFATTKAKIEATKEKLKAMTVVDVKGLTGQYDKIKTEIISKTTQTQNVQNMYEIITKFTMPVNLQDKLRGKLPSALLLFLIEPKSTPATNKALATFTAEKITAAKAAATSATTTPATTPATAKASFGRRKRKRKVKRKKVSKKLPAALKRMCKKYKVRLTVKRNGKRVYKSEKVLKKQCKNALKRRKK